MARSPEGDNPDQAARCPICRAPSVRRWRPFCSKRCADVDLGRWLTGGYAIPGDEAQEDGVPDHDGAPGVDDPDSH